MRFQHSAIGAALALWYVVPGADAGRTYAAPVTVALVAIAVVWLLGHFSCGRPKFLRRDTRPMNRSAVVVTLLVFAAFHALSGSSQGLVIEGTFKLVPDAPSAPASDGLLLWVDASDPSSVLRQSGDEVTTWVDKSGSGHSLTGSAGSLPQYVASGINAKPVVRFGGDDALTMDFGIGHPYTVFSVSRLEGSQNGRLIASSYNNWLIGYWGGNKDMMYADGWVTSNQGPVADTAVHFYGGTGDGIVSSLYDGDRLVVASSAGGRSGPYGISLGGWKWQNSTLYEASKGDVAEVVVYNRVLSNSDRQSLVRYLTTKWLAGMPTDLVPDNEPVSILASGVFDLNGFSETIGSLSGETGSRVLLGTGALITGGDGTSTVFSGVISGSGAVTKNGAGTMTINGPAASTFTGPTTVQGGSLTLDFTNLATRTNLIAGASALVLNGGALNVKGNASGTTTQTFNGLTVKPGRSAAVLDANGGAATNLALGPITRSIGGTVDFSLSARCSITTTAGNDATGILGGWATVSGADWASAAGSGSPRSVVAYTGYIDNVWATGNNTTVTANSGAPAGSTTNSLRFAGAGARTVTLSGTNVIASGGILVAPSVGANLTQILGGSVAGAAGKDLVVLQNNVSGGLTIGSVVANNGTATGLTKSGGGTLALTGSNTYTGPTTINDGTLQVSRDNNLGAASAPLQFNGGTLETSLGFTSSRPITLDLQGGTVNTREFSVTLAGAITGSASLTKTGTGTLRLSGSNSYGGTTTVGGGTLQLGQSSAIPQASAVNVISGARLDASAIATTIGSLQGGGAVVLGSGSLTTGGDNTSTTFSGVISGAARVTKTGIGSLTFTGSSTYTGPTTVVAGKLLVSSPGTLVSPVTVGSGATLAGTGTVGGVTVNPGGHLAPGNSIGTLTLTGGLSLANGAKLDFELGALGSNDLISMPSSTLTLSGQQFADFTFTPLSGFGPGTYTLIDARGINGGLGLITTGTINGLSATLAVDTVHNDLVLNVVPEPGTLALLAIGALSLVALTRFRRTGRV